MEDNNEPREEEGLLYPLSCCIIIGGLDIPLIGDLSKDIAESYGVLEKEGVASRATVIIDTKGIIRHKSINDLSVERNVDEVLRLVKTFQLADKHCPTGWKPRDKGVRNASILSF